MNNGEKKKKTSRTLEELVNRRRIHFRVLERVAPGSMIGMVPFIAEAVLALSVLGIGDPEDPLNPHNTDGLSFPDFSDEELPAMAELTALRTIKGLDDEILDIGLLDFSRDSEDYSTPVRDSQVSGRNDSLFEYDFTADNAIGRGGNDPTPPNPKIPTIDPPIPPGDPKVPEPPVLPPPFNSPLILLTPGEDPYTTIQADSSLLSDPSNVKDNPNTPWVEGLMDSVRNQNDSKLTPYQNEYLNARSNTINSGQSWSLIANAFNPGLPSGGIVSYDFWLQDDSGIFKAVGSSANSLDGDAQANYADYALQEGQTYQGKVLVTDARGQQAISFSSFYVNKGPLFLAPGDDGSKTPGVIDDPSMTDPAHTNDNPATNYVEGRLDAVMNQVGNPLTISNVIANDRDWQAVANAFDPDGTIQRYDFWVKDNSGDFVSLAHDSDSLKSGIITVDYEALALTPGASYDMKVRAIDNNGAEAFSFDTFRVNLPPDALPDSFNTNEDTALNISAAGLLANDSDPDGNSLSISSFTSTSKGLLNYDGTNFTYNPNANYNGPDSFTYTISDGQGGFDTTTVSINVTPINDLPVAIDDLYIAQQDTLLNIPASGVLVNDYDTDSPADPLNVDLSKLPLSSVQGGTIALNLDGSFSYKGASGFSGIDSFEYWVSDGQGGFDSATVTIAVQGIAAPLNAPPSATNDRVVINEDSSISFNALDGTTISAGSQTGTSLGLDSDPDGDSIKMISLAGAKNGTVSFAADGTVSYAAKADFNGTEVLEYIIGDGNGGFATGQITIEVLPTNDAPVAVDDLYQAQQETLLTIPASGVLVNDFDTDTPADPLNVDVTKVPALSAQGGTVSLNADGSFSYQGASGFSGLDSFEYWVSDGQGGFDNATVNILVTGIPSANNPPLAVDDTLVILEDSSISFNALDGSTFYSGSAQAGTALGLDSDADLDSLSLLSLTGAKNGTVSFAADGRVNYTANAGFSGSEVLNYSIGDGNGGFDTGQINISVLPVNDPPVAIDDSYLAKQDTELTIPLATGVLVNDFDTDTIPDPLNVDLTKLPLSSVQGGTVALNLDGSFSYKGASGFSGLDSFDYWVSDGNGGFDSATVSIVVAATPVTPNTPPVAANDTVVILEDSSISFSALDGVTIYSGTAQTGSALGLDSDPNGDTIQLLSLSGAKNGVVSFAADGKVSYNPNLNFNGTENLEYVIGDGKGGFAQGKITLIVQPVDDLPSGGIDAVAVPTLVYNDTDQIQFGDSLVFGIDVKDPDGIAKYSFSVNGTEDNNFYLTTGDLSTAVNAYGAKLAPGSSNDLAVKVYDQAGNAPVLFTDKILVTAPEPIAQLNIPTNTTFDIDGTSGPIAPNSGWNAGSVTLDANGSKASNLLAPIAKYEFDFNNDGTYDYYESTGFAPDGSFDGITNKAFATGKQTVGLRVTDIFGFSDTTSSSFTVNSAPDAKLITPVQGAKGVIISLFGNTSTDPDGNLLEYQFEIFDSANKLITTIEEYAPTADGKAGFIFSDLGKYKVVLTTTDTLGLLDTSTNFIQIVTNPSAGLNIDGDLNNSGSINLVNGQIPTGPGTDKVVGGSDTSLGNKSNSFTAPNNGTEGFLNKDKSSYLLPTDEGAGISFNAGSPPGTPPPAKPGWSIVNVDAWVTLDATKSLSASGLAGGIESYQFDFNNDGVIDYIESKTDKNGDGTFEYFFELQGSQILTPTDKLQVDLINGGAQPIAVTVSINPTETFTGITAIQQAENFLESYNLKTSMQSSDPNKLAFGKENYTVTFEYADGSKVSQVEYFYLVDTASTLFDTKFDGVTKFKFIPGYQIDPDSVPHLFASEFDITSEFIDAKVTITDEFGLSAAAMDKFQLNFKSLLPPTASLELFYSGQQQDLWTVKAGQTFYLDTSGAFDPDGNLVGRFIDIGGDQVYEFSGSDKNYAQEYVIFDAGTYKIGTVVLDDGGRLSPPIYKTLVVTPNAAPKITFDLSGDIYDQYGFASTFDPLRLEANVIEPDGDQVIRTEFYFSSGGGYYFGNPNYIEWKGGYDQNGDGKIGIINISLLSSEKDYRGAYVTYGVQANEALDFSQDGVVDGKVEHTYSGGGKQKIMVAAYDQYGAKGYTVFEGPDNSVQTDDFIEIKYALFTDVLTEQYVFNAIDPKTGEKNSIGWVQASDSYAIFGEITKYEFDFDSSTPYYNTLIDLTDSVIKVTDYYEEWLAGADGKYGFEGIDDAQKAQFALDDEKFALDGKFDGKFEGEYFYEDSKPGNRAVGVRITDNLGNKVSSYDFLLINAPPTTNVTVTHANPNKPGSLVLIDSVARDEFTRITVSGVASLGIQKSEFNIFEVGDTDGDGNFGELIYSYAEGFVYDANGFEWKSAGLDNKLGTADDVSLAGISSGADEILGTNDDVFAPDGVFSGSHKYTFPRQGEYKVVSKVTDLFGLSAISEKNFYAYEGTPDTSFLLSQIDSTGKTITDGRNYDPDSTFVLYNATAGNILLDASATTIPDGKGEITEYWFDSGLGAPDYDYVEVREAGLDNKFGTTDDIFSGYSFELDKTKNTIVKVLSSFDSSFDGKHEFTFQDSDAANVAEANVKVVSSSGAFARSLNTLWALNTGPYSNNDTVAVSQIDPGKDKIWGTGDDGIGAPQFGIVQVDDKQETNEFVIDASYRVFDLEGLVTKYQFWLDQDGDGITEYTYSEERLAGADKILGNADDTYSAADGDFDGKHASTFLPKAANGSLDIREVKTQAWDQIGMASEVFNNFITVNSAPTNGLSLADAQLGNVSQIFALGQKVLLNSNSSDPNQIFSDLWKGPGTGTYSTAFSYLGPYDFLGKLGKYEFEIYDQNGGLIWEYSETEPYYNVKSASYIKGGTATYEDSIGIAADGKVDGKTFFSFDKTGTYTIKSSSSDLFGLSDSSSLTISIVEAPAISFVATQSAGSTLANNTLDLSASAFGAVSYSFDLDGDGDLDLTNTSGLAQGVSFATNGDFVPSVTIVDQNGLVFSQSLKVNTPKTIGFSALPKLVNTGDQINYYFGIFSDTDNDLVSYRLEFDKDVNGDGKLGDFVSFDSALNVTGGNANLIANIDNSKFLVSTAPILGVGAVEAKLYAIDGLGLSAVASHQFTINTAPELDFNAPSFVGQNQNTVFDASGSSDLEKNLVKYSFDFNNDGKTDYVEWARGYDHDGNKTLAYLESVQDFALDGQFDGLVSNTHLLDTNGDKKGDTSIRELFFSQLGNYEYTVTIEDSLGLKASSQRTISVVDGPEILAIGPTGLIVGKAYELELRNLNAGSAPIEKYYFDFNFDGTWDYVESSSNAPDGTFDGKTSYNFSTPGEYNVKAQILDTAGVFSEGKISFKVNSPPEISFIDALSENVTFAAQANENIIAAGAKLSPKIFVGDADSNISSYSYNIKQLYTQRSSTRNRIFRY